MHYLRNISVVMLFLFSPCFGQESEFNDSYYWPLKLQKQFSSGFGDTRPGRFHMGVDLRTGGKEGARVHAPEDGYVFRIKTSYNGYGKGLYLKGNSGRIYVFGHLQKFNWDIGTYLQKRQIESERYYQDISPEPDELPVKRGDFIARSGQTGAGAPHLHFEIRDENQSPLNPLYFNVGINDKSAPDFEAIWITYLDDFSLFEDGSREKKIIPKRSGQNSDFLGDTIVVGGRFGVKAAVSDIITHGSFTLGASKLTLYVDGEKYYSIDYRRIPYEENLYSLLDKDDDERKKENYKRVYNLYRRIGNNFSGCATPANGDGTIEFSSDGFHDIRIEAYDSFGNRRSLSFVIYYLVNSEILEPFNRATVEDTLIELKYAQGIDSSYYDSVLITHPDSGSLPVRVFPAIENTNHSLRLKADFSQWPHYQIRFEKNGILFPAYNISTNNIRPAGQKAVDSITVELIDDGLLLNAYTAYPSINWLLAEIVTDAGRERLSYRKYDTTKFSLFFKPSDDITKIKSIITRGPIGFLPDSLNDTIHHVKAGAEIDISLKEGINLHFESDDLFADLLLRIKDTVTAAPETGYYIGTPFEIFPAVMSFADWADLKSAIGESPNIDKIGLYVYHDEKGWLWAGGEYDKTSGILSSDLGGAGLVALIADTTAPKIKSLNIEENGRVKISHPEIRFIVDDELSKIENDLNFDVTIDDRWISPEFDPERQTFKSKPHWRLTPGKHILKIEITDRCGNKTVLVRNFRVQSAG
ncbi:MAG: M23 family metallopeptidase [candidate division Zixibacteria bacterium]